MKSSLKDSRARILALDVRSYRIGYVAMEAPGRVLDFGVTRFRKRRILVAIACLSRILERFHPDVLVLRKVSASSTRNTSGTRRIARLATLYARRNKIVAVMIREKQVRDHFDDKGAHTKYRAALFLLNQFPELEWKLPPPRKAWKREHPNMSIFDAAALGVTYLTSMSQSSGA